MLCYVGTRGMGALEYTPSLDRPTINATVDVSRLREFAALAFEDDVSWSTELSAGEGMEELLEVGTSAGGARPKAVIGWNPETNEVRSGRVDLADGFQYWILKFDGVGDGAREFGRSRGYGSIEYAYSLMAARAGVQMSECRIFAEGGRKHFMTRRFDRRDNGSKLHMQTHAGLSHVDFNLPGSASYEDVFDVLRSIDTPGTDIEQQYIRMLFNVVARNQDDHPKNISYLMDKQGQWRLSPAYDLSFAFNPTGEYTSRHQMSINGKLDGFVAADFEAIAARAGIVRGRWRALLDQVVASTNEWAAIANDAEVPHERAETIREAFRLKF
jgi:serine/threonine-protein kinase HipA